MLNKTARRLTSMLLSVLLLATLFITATVSPALAEEESSNLLAQLKISPTVYNVKYDFSWADYEQNQSFDYSKSTMSVQESTRDWSLLYNESNTDKIGAIYYTHLDAWSYRRAYMYDLGASYKLSELSLWTRSGDGRTVMQFSVYGSLTEFADYGLTSDKLLGTFSTAAKTEKVTATLNSAKNVRYIMIVFDVLRNDPGNLNDKDTTTSTAYSYSGIDSTRYATTFSGCNHSESTGNPFIDEVVIHGTAGQELTPVLGNGTENANTSARVYSITHQLDWNDTAPDYSNAAIVESVSSWSSQIKSDGTGTFTSTPTTVTEYTAILTDGTDLTTDSSSRKNEVWVGTSASNANANKRRVALLYDLGKEYELAEIEISVPLKHINDKRYIYAFSVYGGKTADIEKLLDGQRLGYGGGTTAQVTASLSSDTAVRYMLITFDQLGTDYSEGAAGDASYTDKALCSSKNGLAYLSEIAVYGFECEKQSSNILANNGNVAISAYSVDKELDWTKENLDYSQSTATAGNRLQDMDDSAAYTVLKANDENSKITNGNKNNFFSFSEDGTDLFKIGERSTPKDTRYAVMFDLGGYYKLDAMQLFSTATRAKAYRRIYNYTVFAGNTADATELLHTTPVGYGGSSTAAAGAELITEDAVRYVLVVFDRLGTDPSPDNNGNSATVDIHASMWYGEMYLTEIELYGTMQLGSAEVTDGESPSLTLDSASNEVTVAIPEGKWLKAGSLYYTVEGSETKYPILSRKGALNADGTFNTEGEANTNEFVFTLPSADGAVTVHADYVDIGAKNMAVMAVSATPYADANGKVKLRFLSRVHRSYTAGDVNYTLLNCGALLINKTSAGDTEIDPAAIVEAIENGETVSYARIVPTTVLYDRCDDYVEYTTAIKLNSEGDYLDKDYMSIAYAVYKSENGGENVVLYSDDNKTNNYAAVTAADKADDLGAPWYRTRNGLGNTYAKLTNGEQVNVVYIGGSITFGIGIENTEEASYPVLATNWMKEAYPDATINMTKAAIGGSGSQWGAYGVEKDILSHDPDLVFLEFAVNDEICIGADYYTLDDATVYYETIIRTIREKSPECDIVALYTVNGYYADKSYTSENGALETLWYPSAAAHDKIAEHYNVPSVSLGYRLRCLIDGEDPTYVDDDGATQYAIKKYLYDGTHGTADGYKLYGEILSDALNRMLGSAATAEIKVKKTATPADTYCTVAEVESMMNATFIRVKDTSVFTASTGWENKTTYWKDSRFVNYTDGYIATSTEENELVYTFTGTNFGLMAQANNTGDMIEWFIEEEGVTTFAEAEAAGVISSSQRISNYPLMVAEELESGTHTIHMRWAGFTESGTKPTIAALFYN